MEEPATLPPQPSASIKAGTRHVTRESTHLIPGFALVGDGGAYSERGSLRRHVAGDLFRLLSHPVIARYAQHRVPGEKDAYLGQSVIWTEVCAVFVNYLLGQ